MTLEAYILYVGQTKFPDFHVLSYIMIQNYLCKGGSIERSSNDLHRNGIYALLSKGKHNEYSLYMTILFFRGQEFFRLGLSMGLSELKFLG